MDAIRWERIQAVFHRAADLPDAERRSYVARECGDDAELLADVLTLLEEDARAAPLLDAGRDALAHVAGRVLDGATVPTMPLHDFGPYHVTSVLGEGGMGVVYLAERADLGSRAAVKILRDAWLSPARRARFAAEQRTLAQLSHPSIARLFDAGTLADGTPWFVMEYVDGVPLTAYADARALAVVDRLRLFRDVCEAVQHAHRHAVLHRDLKPSNILVTGEGGVKLLDFGIAKHLEGAGGMEEQTRTGLRLMTPAYAAPEQLRGERLGVHTDVYALGVILYELLAGRLPFDLSSRTPSEAETLLLEGEPERPSAVAGRTPNAGRAAWADLDVLCLTAMHKDPARRYGTVDALVRDVDHFLRGEPLDARPDTLGYTLGKFVRRRWRIVSATAAALAVVIALVVFYTVRLAAARNDAVAESARTQRIQRFMLTLFHGGDDVAGPADSLRVVTLLDRGAREARSLDGEPEVQAALLATLGGLYQRLGRLPAADSLLTFALARDSALHGAASAETGASLVALGLLRVDQARLPEAEQLVRRGLTTARAALGPGAPAVARAQAALGKVLHERSAYPGAVAELDSAVRIQSAADSLTPDRLASLRELAQVHFSASRYEAADSLGRVVLAASRRLHGDRHPTVAEDLETLGEIAHMRGRYPEAERYLREALAITEGWYGADHPSTAVVLTSLGQDLMFEERYDEATALLKRALAIRERAYGPNHPLVASTVNELGGIALQQDRFDEAEADFRRMIDIYRAVYGPQHHFLGIAVSNLASVYHAKHDYARAEQRYREALAIYQRALPADHLDVGIAQMKLGHTLVKAKRWADALPHSLAGYETISRHADSSVEWLVWVRRDLVLEYDSTGQPARAARFRAEVARDSAAKR
jgi:serine/threonine-protein kinase